MSNQEHASSLPQINVVDCRNSTERNICEAKEEGICCYSEATHTYTTSEDIQRQLCDYHFRKLLRMIYIWHALRRETGGAA